METETNQNQSRKPDTDTIDHLFLELSQFTKATTGKELRYEKALKAIEAGAEDPSKIASEALSGVYPLR